MSNWSFSTLLDNLNTATKGWGVQIIGILGIALLLWCAYMVFSKFTAGDRHRDQSWVLIIVAGVVGGFMAFSAASWFVLGQGLGTTVNELGTTGAILFPLL